MQLLPASAVTDMAFPERHAVGFVQVLQISGSCPPA